MFTGRDEISIALERVGRILVTSGSLQEYELLVCGGAALVFNGFIERATKDVDVLATLARTSEGSLYLGQNPDLPGELQEAAEQAPTN